MRIAKTAPVVISLVLVAGLSACGVQSPGATTSPQPSAAVTVSPAVSPSAATSTASTPTPAVHKLGPTGVGALLLGMTKTEAIATGLTTGVQGTEGSCGQASDGRLAGARPASADDPDGTLFFSVTSGKLVIISATTGVLTPEGIHLGSTASEVKKAYPKWSGGAVDSLDYVKVPKNPKAYYRIYVDDDQVLELTLLAADQDCAE